MWSKLKFLETNYKKLSIKTSCFHAYLKLNFYTKKVLNAPIAPIGLHDRILTRKKKFKNLINNYF